MELGVEWIDAATAADRLGVKPATLYAYVSRGVLKRRHEGRRSLFDAAEIETLARRGRPRGQPPELVIESAVTALGADRPYYRGHDALTLARTAGFEATAEWLWTEHASPAGPDSHPGPSADSPGTVTKDRSGVGRDDPPDREPGTAPTWQADADAVQAAVAAQRDLPESLLPLDRLQVITTVLGATDLLRFQLDPASVTATARRLITGLVDALPVLGPPDAHDPSRPEPDDEFSRPAPGWADEPGRPAPRSGDAPGRLRPGAGDESGGFGPGRRDEGGRLRPEVEWLGDDAGQAVPERGRGAGQREPEAGTAAESSSPVPRSIAERLWPRLTPHPPSPSLLRALEAALVLLADHELAASTLAARVAASAKADPYAVVITGLGVLGGPLHGGASYAAERLLAEVTRPSDAPRVIADRIRRGERIPGFGHTVYKNGDARATTLLDLVTEAAPGHDRLAAARAVLAEARRRRLPEPNVDFGLATLAAVAGMTPGAGEAIFAVARTAGWLAHAMEEYARGSLLRLRASYTGPPIPRP
ncbi:citrate synthase [Nonomuraea sp. NPDC050478]|uniref:citrate synthase n=1 Tax=Nonomuraea sp. NPDC050478 TaxID=3364365 RepID=UPI003799E428